MHAEVVARAPALGKWRRWLHQKEPMRARLFRIAQLFIRRTNIAKLLGLAFRWKVAHQAENRRV